MKIDEKKMIKEAVNKGINRYVVGAFIINEGKILLLKRKHDDFMGGYYEMPSGKVEGEETLYEALFREVKEETGLEIKKIINYENYFDYETKSGTTRQFNFDVETNKGDIVISEHEDFRWCNLNDLKSLKISEGMYKLVSEKISD